MGIQASHCFPSVFVFFDGVVCILLVQRRREENILTESGVL